MGYVICSETQLCGTELFILDDNHARGYKEWEGYFVVSHCHFDEEEKNKRVVGNTWFANQHNWITSEEPYKKNHIRRVVN